MTNAPIVLFAYNRPTHLASTLAALSACPEWRGSPVYVYCDGPRSTFDEQLVEETRRVARGIAHPDAHVIAADVNLGLANSIIKGVGQLCEQFGRVVVIEDDLLVSPSFLSYMNRALECYAARPEVLQISGYMFDVPEFRDRMRVLLMPLTTTWGWATWKRAWDLFKPDDDGWLRMRQNKQERRIFNLGNNYDFFSMLEAQASGKRDSWGIRWYWSVFSAKGLVCHPPRTLVANAGMDGSGTNGRGRFRSFSGTRSAPSELLPEMAAGDVRCSEAEWSAVKHAIWRQNGGYLGRAIDVLKSIVR